MTHTRSIDRKRVDAGHLSTRLLKEYAEAPDAFGEDAVESIWAHLDVCDDCADLYDRIKESDVSGVSEGDAPADKPSRTPKTPAHSADMPPRRTKKSTHSKRAPVPPKKTPAHAKVRWELQSTEFRALLRQWRSSRGASWVAAVIAVVVATAFVYFFSASPPSTVAHWATSEVFTSKVPVQEVSVSLVRSGRSKSAHSEIDLAGIAALVIAVDLDRISRWAPHYEAVIIDPEGSEMFRSEIDPAYFDDGRFMLQLVTQHFRSGDYTIRIDAEDDSGVVSPVARGTFSATR